MAYNIILTKEEKKEMFETIENVLDIKLNQNKEEEIYNKIINFYSKKIKKELKREKIGFKKLFEKNYVLNIVLNYGELNHNPASLIDFKSFKRAKLYEYKENLKKLLREYIK